MFSKIFGSRRAPKVTALVPDRSPSPLRIIHAGGYVEYYYTATPAVTIIEKYPRAVLTRPDVFHRPWEAVVHPDEILTPGEKFYIVPRRTVLKLQKRARRPRASQPQPDTVIVSEGESKRSDKVITKKNVKLSSRRARFAGTWQPRRLWRSTSDRRSRHRCLLRQLKASYDRFNNMFCIFIH